VNSLLRIPYAFAGAVAEGLVRITPVGKTKFQRGLSARRDVVGRFYRWAAANRDDRRPLVWFHAPSVGEGLQALPVIDLLRQQRPDAQIVYTFYSPSAEQFAKSVKADIADYLPFDTVSHARGMISALRPNALVFSIRGTSYSAKGQYDRAIQDFDQALRLSPNEAVPLSSRCYAKASAGALAAALADCDEALRRMPGHADFLDSRGFTYLKMRKLPQALADYDASLKVDPGHAAARFGRGVVRRQMGDVSGGDADIAAATAIDGSVAGRLARRGVVP